MNEFCELQVPARSLCHMQLCIITVGCCSLAHSNNLLVKFVVTTHTVVLAGCCSEAGLPFHQAEAAAVCVRKLPVLSR